MANAKKHTIETTRAGCIYLLKKGYFFKQIKMPSSSFLWATTIAVLSCNAVYYISPWIREKMWQWTTPLDKFSPKEKDGGEENDDDGIWF
jgi:hypothetical protein